jgi:hypothetical protein
MSVVLAIAGRWLPRQVLWPQGEGQIIGVLGVTSASSAADRVLQERRPMVHEVDEELREIKREIIESRGLVIKTNNLTNALSADIRSIAKRQTTYERRITWNSATSYVVFVLVVFAALKLAMDARIDQLKGESEQRVKDIARMKDELNRSNERETARQTADERAAKFYELVRQGKRARAAGQALGPHRPVGDDEGPAAEQGRGGDVR